MSPIKKQILVFACLLLVITACNAPQPQALAPAETTAFSTAVSPTPALEGLAGLPAATPATNSSPTTAPGVAHSGLEGAAGLRVAYLSAGDVWAWAEGANPVQLTRHGQAADLRLSPDGQLVAYLRQIDEVFSELWIVNADSGDERPLVSREQLAELDPGANVLPQTFEWIPGSRRLAFNTQKQPDAPGFFPYNDLRAVDAGSGEISTLQAPGKGGEFSLSPDGRQVALILPEQISLVNLDGSSRRASVLAYPAISTYSEAPFYPEPVWAGDSGSLRVAIPSIDPLAKPNTPTAIWQVPADGSPASQLSSVETVPFFISPVIFSPDLQQVAYLASLGESAANQYELHIVSIDGKNDGVYFTGDVRLESWMPDSLHFIFRGPGDELYTGTVNDAILEPLTDTPTGSNLRWIDATRFLFVSSSPEAKELRLQQKGAESSQLIASLPVSGSSIFDFSP